MAQTTCSIDAVGRVALDEKQTTPPKCGVFISDKGCDSRLNETLNFVLWGAAKPERLTRII